MKAKELEDLEENLLKSGYKKFTKCLSSSESWGWFKSKFEDPCKDKDEEGNRSWTIEYRIWDHTKYAGTHPHLDRSPYSLDILILNGDSNQRIDLEITTPVFSIDTCERLADDLHNMLRPYVEDVNNHLKK